LSRQEAFSEAAYTQTWLKTRWKKVWTCRTGTIDCCRTSPGTPSTWPSRPWAWCHRPGTSHSFHWDWRTAWLSCRRTQPPSGIQTRAGATLTALVWTFWWALVWRSEPGYLCHTCQWLRPAGAFPLPSRHQAAASSWAAGQNKFIDIRRRIFIVKYWDLAV